MALMMTDVYRPYPYYPYGPTGIRYPVNTRILGVPVRTVSPAVAAITPSITINMPAQPAPVTPVQSGAPADVAAQESWLDQSSVGGMSNKLLLGVAAVAAFFYFSSKGK